MFTLQKCRQLLGMTVLSLCCGLATAQQASYGAPVNLETAKKIAVGAAAEAKRLNLSVAISIVDTHGFPVYFELLDDTQSGSGQLALLKSRTAAMYRRPTKAFEDAVAGGRNALLSIPDALLLEGGLPIIVNGKVIGGVGASGGTSAQDAHIARAGLDALK